MVHIVMAVFSRAGDNALAIHISASGPRSALQPVLCGQSSLLILIGESLPLQ